MRYLQVKGGQQLHIILDYGDAGYGLPLCGRKLNNLNTTHGYKMTINAPLGHECKNCRRILNSKAKRGLV
jgi:hypothetical protein